MSFTRENVRTRVITSFNVWYLFSKWYIVITWHICIIFTRTILGVHIFHYYSSNSITSNYIVFTGVKNLSAVSGARTCISLVRSTAGCKCLFSHTDMQLRHVRVRCMRFFRIFSPFSLSKHYYIVQYRRKNTFSCRRDCQLLCCHSAPLLWTCLFFNTYSRYFSLHFLVYTVQFRRVTTELCNLTPNSRICVALMVSAPYIVA